MPIMRWPWFALVVPCICAGEVPNSDQAQTAQLRIVSSSPDQVTGSDVLVDLGDLSGGPWELRLNDRSVSEQLRPSAINHHLVGRLTGLRLGRNFLALRIGNGRPLTMELISHPVAGPLFSGPHQQPFICETEKNGLGPPLDADCNSETIIKYYYRSTGADTAGGKKSDVAPGGLGVGFKEYEAGSPLPNDVQRISVSDHRQVDYVIRREIGVINRAVFDIQVLAPPGEPLPDPWRRSPSSWNGRLVYEFGGGCGAGHHQGILSDNPRDALLSAGYAVASATLSDPGTNCNDRVAAETVAMVKEYFTKKYGEPVHTIGVGRSSGASREQLIAQDYPGLLDGIVLISSFPDTMTGDAISFTDCSLLARAFSKSTEVWTEEQKTAVSGFATWHTCRYWKEFKLPIVDPTLCNENGGGKVIPFLPKDITYDRSSNPRGVRCDIYDGASNELGSDPTTGIARRPLDNTGVEYGLVAFNKGIISAEQFVDVNEQVGGYDKDGMMTFTRTEADPEAVRIAYAQGLVLTGEGALSQTPIIDQRWYSDDLADIHDRYRSFVTRARLITATGTADNQVMLIAPRVEILPLEAPALFLDGYVEAIAQRERDLVHEMDRWLDEIEADRLPGTLSAKISRSKPSSLADACWDIGGRKIVEPATYKGAGLCDQLYPAYGDPRLAAGAPLNDDVLKCRLKPLSVANYVHPFSVEQWKRLMLVFPRGVCDYSLPALGKASISEKKRTVEAR